MNKKILIASLFATLMLLVPMTSVIGVSDVEDDCGCEVVSSSNLVRVERLLARLEVYINIILLRFGHIPDVQEKCQEIIDVINSNRQLDFPIICDILESIWNQLNYIANNINYLLSELEDISIIANIIVIFLGFPVGCIALIVYSLGLSFGCECLPPNPYPNIFHF